MNPFTSTDIAGLRVLLVDDEIFIREMASDVLSLLGCTTTVASDGREAWNIFRENPSEFDIIITDYNMPEMTGIDLAAKVLDLKPNLPLIISTGFASGFTDKQASDLGISCILPKPYMIQELKDAILEAVSQLKLN